MRVPTSLCCRSACGPINDNAWEIWVAKGLLATGEPIRDGPTKGGQAKGESACFLRHAVRNVHLVIIRTVQRLVVTDSISSKEHQLITDTNQVACIAAVACAQRDNR